MGVERGSLGLEWFMVVWFENEKNKFKVYRDKILANWVG